MNTHSEIRNLEHITIKDGATPEIVEMQVDGIIEQFGQLVKTCFEQTENAIALLSSWDGRLCSAQFESNKNKELKRFFQLLQRNCSVGTPKYILRAPLWKALLFSNEKLLRYDLCHRNGNSIKYDLLMAVWYNHSKLREVELQTFLKVFDEKGDDQELLSVSKLILFLKMLLDVKYLMEMILQQHYQLWKLNLNRRQKTLFRIYGTTHFIRRTKLCKLELSKLLM